MGPGEKTLSSRAPRLGWTLLLLAAACSTSRLPSSSGALIPSISPADLVASLADVANGRNPDMTETGLVLKQIELKLLVGQSQDAGLLQQGQEDVVVRVLDIGNRSIGHIMTPRTEVDWIDANDSRDEILRTIPFTKGTS